MTMRAEPMTDALAGQWHHHLLSASASAALSAEVWLRAAPRSQDRCIDLGAGVGMLTVPLSREVAEMVAVEPSKALAARLAARAREHGASEIRMETVPITELVMPRQSCDLVVSGLALHHCENAEKRALVARALRWLRPGGRLVIADLMPQGKGFGGPRGFRPGVQDSHALVRLDRRARRVSHSPA